MPSTSQSRRGRVTDMWYHCLTMVKLNAHFDGKVIVPDEPLALKPNQRVRIQVEPIDEPARSETKRRLGLQRGAVSYIAPDFDAELSDGFWVGEK
jgi:hypothetical protein